MEKVMTRNTGTLRDVLFDELDALRKGDGDVQRANAVAKIAGQIISTAKVEIEYCKLQMAAQETGRQIAMGSMDLGSAALAAPSTEKPNAH